MIFRVFLNRLNFTYFVFVQTRWRLGVHLGYLYDSLRDACLLLSLRLLGMRVLEERGFRGPISIHGKGHGHDWIHKFAILLCRVKDRMKIVSFRSTRSADRFQFECAPFLLREPVDIAEDLGGHELRVVSAGGLLLRL